MSTALIVVDVQNDFTEGGALAVAGGAALAGALTHYLAAGDRYDVVVATRDWHHAPPDTNDGHFATGEPDYVTTWPVHCVAGTPGAEYHPDLVLPARTVHVVKGEGRQDYSGFAGRIDRGEQRAGQQPGESRSLAEVLRAEGVTDVDVVGIATDHCVRATALDARTAGFDVRVLADLTVGVSEVTTREALAQLRAADVTVLGEPGR